MAIVNSCRFKIKSGGPLLFVSHFALFFVIGHVQANELLEHGGNTGHRVPYKFYQLEVDNLSQIGEINSILQDEQGFMWFAGQGGLARYDGYELKLFLNNDSPDSISTNSVNDVILAKNGELWVATYWGLNRYDHSSNKFTRIMHDENNENSLSSNAILCLMQSTDGMIWLGTRGGGLDRYDASSGEFQHYIKEDKEAATNSLTQQALTSNVISSLFEDSRGYIWVGYIDDGVTRLKLGEQGQVLEKLNFSKADSVYLSDRVFNITEDKNGGIWFAGQKGPLKFEYDDDGIQGRLVDIKAKGLWPKLSHGGTAKSAYIDPQNNMWMATSSNGLNILNLEHQVVNRYIPNRKAQPTVTYIDKDGGTWLGMRPYGIMRVNRYASSFSNFRDFDFETHDGNKSNEILAISQDSKNNLWLSSTRNLFYLDRSDNSFSYDFKHERKKPKGKHGGSSTGIMLDGDKNLWYASQWFGVQNLDINTGEVRHYMPDKTKDKALGDREVWSGYKDSKGYMWFGAHRGWLSRYNKETDDFYSVNVNPGGIANRLMSIFEDSKGGLWIGADNGLYHAKTIDKPTQFLRYSGSHDDTIIKPANDSIMSIFEDRDKNMWFGSNGGGVYRLSHDRSKFDAFMMAQGLASNIVNGILQDEKGYLWFATDAGLSRFEPRSGSFRNYTKKDGLPGNAFTVNAHIKLPSGEFALGTKEGFTIFHPQSLFENKSEPVARMTKFYLFNQEVLPQAHSNEQADKNPLLRQVINHTKQITLNHKQSVFGFEFSALAYEAPEKNEYSYFLEGFDNEWVESGNKRTATYTNLDPGQYTFHVKASNNEGLWSENSTKLKITVLPPWWKTWWAYAIYIGFIVLMIVKAFYSQYKKRLLTEQQNKRLEVTVKERTKELSEKNDDINAMLSHMHQGLFSITKEGLIHHEYSRYLSRIFETDDITDRSAEDLLFEHSELAEDIRDTTKVAIDAIVGECPLNFEFNSHLLAREYDIRIFKQGRTLVKHLELSWNPIIENDLVQKLLVTVWDRTLVKKLESEAKGKREELEMVGQLLQLSQSKFSNFVSYTRDNISHCRELLLKYKILPEDKYEDVISVLFRNMHTLKGAARTYGFALLSEPAHLTETRYSALRERTERWQQQTLLDDLDHVEQALNQYITIYSEVLGREDTLGEAGKGIWLEESELEKLASLLKQDTLSLAQQHLNHCRFISIDEALADVITSLPSIAEELHKPLPELIIKTKGIHFARHACTLFSNVFAHLLRNALDHGIEPASERIKSDKAEQGKIEISAQQQSQCIDLVVCDDGAGLNLNKLYDKGLSDGVWTENDKPTVFEVANVIFVSGMSTKDIVSNISGRGVGMDAVKQFLLEAGGDIRIDLKTLDENQVFSNDMKGNSMFAIRVSLPKSLFYVEE